PARRLPARRLLPRWLSTRRLLPRWPVTGALASRRLRTGLLRGRVRRPAGLTLTRLGRRTTGGWVRRRLLLIRAGLLAASRHRCAASIGDRFGDRVMGLRQTFVRRLGCRLIERHTLLRTVGLVGNGADGMPETLEGLADLARDDPHLVGVALGDL